VLIMDRKARVIIHCPTNRRMSLRGRKRFWCGAGGLLTDAGYRATIDGNDYMQLVIRACAFVAFLVGFFFWPMKCILGRGQK